jgi:NAD(P)-dependent dehydrogenase (short-subunit alcohol dehydrogenase family)
MNLKGKNAVIYGAGGSMGGAFAKAFAGAGASVFLTGRNQTSLQTIANEIISQGGKAEVDLVDAFDEHAIQSHINKLSEKFSLDISFNATGIDVIQDIPLVELKSEEFVLPITQTMQTQFLTATAAGRVMMKQKSGVILSLTATPGGIGYPLTGGFAPSCCALESFSRNLASELGPYGIRVVNIRSGGSPDSRIFKEAIAADPDVMDTVLESMKADTMLKQLPLMTDIANTAVFLASDMAGKITGVSVDVTAGTTSALNYKSSIKNPN